MNVPMTDDYINACTYFSKVVQGQTYTIMKCSDTRKWKNSATKPTPGERNPSCSTSPAPAQQDDSKKRM